MDAHNFHAMPSSRMNHIRAQSKREFTQPARVPAFSVRTAVISVAGVGTRVFPLTTAIEKCMLPVYAGPLSRPLVDFTVMECIRAGIARIIFVCTERGKQQLSDYYGPLNSDIVQNLQRLGKSVLINEEEKRRATGVEFTYVVQSSEGQGTAFALYCAKQHISSEQRFAYLGGDDFVWNARGQTELSRSIAEWQYSGADHVLMGNPVLPDQAGKYGIIQTDTTGKVTYIDEKPPLERIPAQPLANISKYLFNDSIWPYVEAEVATIKTSDQPESYITSVINESAKSGQIIHAHRIHGTYLDGGNPDGLLYAGNYIKSQLHGSW